jgi:hypothetical protein
MNKLFAAVCLTTVMVIHPAVAEVASECVTEYIRDGLLKKTASNQSSHAKLVILARISQMSFNDSADTLGHTGEVGFGSFKIGPGSWNKDKHEQFKTEFSKTEDVTQILNSETSLVISEGDPVLVKGFTDCIALHGGLAMSLREAGSNSAILELTWTPFPTAPNVDPVVHDFNVSNGTISGGADYTKPGAHLGIRLKRIVSLSRNPLKDLAVVINTDNIGGSYAFLPRAETKVSAPEQRVCKLEFAYVKFENKIVGLNAIKGDCIALGKNAGASDVRLGCQAADGTIRFAAERFCIADGVCLSHIPPADATFGPQPNCGWQ